MCKEGIISHFKQKKRENKAEAIFHQPFPFPRQRQNSQKILP